VGQRPEPTHFLFFCRVQADIRKSLAIADQELFSLTASPTCAPPQNRSSPVSSQLPAASGQNCSDMESLWPRELTGISVGPSFSGGGNLLHGDMNNTRQTRSPCRKYGFKTAIISAFRQTANSGTSGSDAGNIHPAIAVPDKYLHPSGHYRQSGADLANAPGPDRCLCSSFECWRKRRKWLLCLGSRNDAIPTSCCPAPRRWDKLRSRQAYFRFSVDRVPPWART
jgi:hypothetical protein